MIQRAVSLIVSLVWFGYSTDVPFTIGVSSPALTWSQELVKARKRVYSPVPLRLRKRWKMSTVCCYFD
jgi:hypothetical protein